jgi:hypothetical protein
MKDNQNNKLGLLPDAKGPLKPRRKAGRGATLTRLEKRYLSRYLCFLCEARLDRDDCYATGWRCPEKVMIKRRADCLKNYKPRSRPALSEQEGE